MSWYYVITDEMRELDLKGNELLVYAIINGFSQNNQGCFYGSISTLQEMLGVAKQTIVSTLHSLCEKGLIERTESTINGVKRVFYNVSGGSLKIRPGVVQNLDQGGLKIRHNNKYIDNNINKTLSNNAHAHKFSKPSIDDIRSYCFQRGNNVDAESFFNFYESKGWLIGKSPMKDWKAAIRTWEKRETQRPAAAPRPRRMSATENNMRIMDEINGTNYAEQLYGPK